MTAKFIDVTGKTEDEAIRKALSELGLERDEVSVEILERAKKGIFGIGASPAKVRITYGLQDDEPAPPPPPKPASSRGAGGAFPPWGREPAWKAPAAPARGERAQAWGAAEGQAHHPGGRR